MLKKLFFILTTFIFTNHIAYASDCSSIIVNPNIVLSSSFGKLEYDYTKTTSEITDIAKSLNISETGLFASGLSTVNVNFDIEVKTLAKPIGNFELCVVPTEIKIFLGFDKPTIYISKELEENSCEYTMVKRHEQVHHQINKKTLEYYLPLFKKAAIDIAKNLKPININDLNNVRPSIIEITNTYNQKLTPLVDFIKKEMIHEQQKLDNPNNYLFENTICK